MSIAGNYMRASWCCDVCFTRPVNAGPTGVQKYMCNGLFPHGGRMLPRRFFLYTSLYLLHLIVFQTKISESHEDFDFKRLLPDCFPKVTVIYILTSSYFQPYLQRVLPCFLLYASWIGICIIVTFFKNCGNIHLT